MAKVVVCNSLKYYFLEVCIKGIETLYQWVDPIMGYPQ